MSTHNICINGDITLLSRAMQTRVLEISSCPLAQRGINIMGTSKFYDKVAIEDNLKFYEVQWNSAIKTSTINSGFYRAKMFFVFFCFFLFTVFDLIKVHTPINNSVVFILQPVYFFVYFFIKALCCGADLNSSSCWYNSNEYPLQVPL